MDSECGEVRVQSDKDHTPQCLEKLMLCSTKLCTPDYIDRNFCFRVGLQQPSLSNVHCVVTAHQACRDKAIGLHVCILSLPC